MIAEIGFFDSLMYTFLFLAFCLWVVGRRLKKAAENHPEITSTIVDIIISKLK